MSASGQSPPNEDPSIVSQDANGEEDASKDVSDAETEPAMLEEEEMPTYMSLTSSSRPDESTAECTIPQRLERTEDGQARACSPYTSEQGAESVCVLSSGDDSDGRPYEMMDDYDSEDMDMEDEEEEEEEDDDEDDSCPNDEEEDIEPEQFERSSDDFVLRYDGGLEKHHKERSRSLQDLTNSRGNLSRFVGKRRSIDFMGSYEPELSRQNFQATVDPLIDRRKIPRSVKYEHVSSKVKLYIQEMKEQTRRSAERKNRESLMEKNVIGANSRGDNADISCARLNPGNRMTKGYVQNAINEIKTNERGNVVDNADYTDIRPIDDRADLIAMSMVEEIREIDDDDDEKNLPNNAITENLPFIPENSVKNVKSNGLIDYSARHQNEKNIEPMDTCASNGQEEIATIFNPRSLSYEEYTNGDEMSKPIIDNLSRPTIQETNELDDYTENNVTGLIQCEIVKISSISRPKDRKIYQTVTDDIVNSHDAWNLHEVTIDESSSSRKKTTQIDREAYQKILDENVSLKRMLDEMTKTLEQCRADSQPREEYLRTLAENASLKRELNDVKETFEQYRVENEPRETKVASVQTEVIENQQQSSTTKEDLKPLMANKLLSSSVTSALSSIEQWSDSNCSAAISIDPPNIENVLNSDDSYAYAERTPRKTLPPLSHSFVTSSRILQTLANITQGRTKSATPITNLTTNVTRPSVEQGQSKRETNNPVLMGNEENSSRAKKRKASDMLGIPGTSQTFKMPHTPGDTRRKINSDSDTDGVYKTTGDRTSKTIDQTIKRNETTERTLDDFDDNGATDVPENVKCFVYHDEPDSKERSFLIQADDSLKNEESVNTAGNARECGPFLLGNVEIRMSEANGTINIWGKEINRSDQVPDVNMDIDDSELHERSTFAPKSSHICQSSPRTKFPIATTLVSSSNKKSKFSPQLSKSGIGKYFRSAASNLMRTNNLPNENEPGCYANSAVIVENRTNACEYCNTNQKRVKLPNCEHHANMRVKQHSCCLHDVEINERDCDCNSDNEVFDESTIYETMSSILANHKNRMAPSINVSAKHSCCNVPNEVICRNHTTNRRYSSGREEDCHPTKKRCSSYTADIPSRNNRLTPGNHSCRDNRSHSHNLISCEDEDQPLISSPEQSETPETKLRRLSGKKVRGILGDLLRGCGGCRDLNSTSNLPRESVDSQNSVPKVRPSPCSPPQGSCSRRMSCPSHSNASNDVVNEKCCNSCSRRTDMQAQIENQLEILRVDMERLRSRSDAFLKMLNVLKTETD